METKQISIIKPQYHSDIYTQIKRSCDIEKDFNLDTLLQYNRENKKIFLFCDIKNKWVFSYWTRLEMKTKTTK